MRDFLFFLPLLLCISAMIYLLSFTLRAAAFVQSDPNRLDNGNFRSGDESVATDPLTVKSMAAKGGN
ncbi:MAG TPA: hypothetical protein VGH36_02605 [Acetobacteraceae bacterium]|jgi:hypothetical protein